MSGRWPDRSILNKKLSALLEFNRRVFIWLEQPIQGMKIGVFLPVIIKISPMAGLQLFPENENSQEWIPKLSKL